MKLQMPGRHTDGEYLLAEGHLFFEAAAVIPIFVDIPVEDARVDEVRPLQAQIEQRSAPLDQPPKAPSAAPPHRLG